MGISICEMKIPKINDRQRQPPCSGEYFSSLLGHDHDDDFGYAFEYVAAAPGPSFFDDPAGTA